jgi:SWIM zinc finger/reverse transcriptase-like protein
MQQREVREPSPRLAGPNRQVYAAGAIALTEPGPAAIGVVITDRRGRVLAHRAYYLGHTTRAQASAEALLSALRLAEAGHLEAPVIKVEHSALVDALQEGRPLPEDHAHLAEALATARAALPGHRLEMISANANLARPVALAPLVDWLPERTQRAEALRVQRIQDHVYEVESETQPGQVYRVTLHPPGVLAQDAPDECECADFQYRGIPCKHMLAVARFTGGQERLFYPEHAGSTPPAGSE